MRRVLVVIAGMMLLLPASALASGDSSIFYYPWWGTKKEDGKFFHWSQYGHAPPTDLATTFYPARGPYSSSDWDVVRAQMDDIKQAGVDEVIISWWGWGSPEDDRLPLVMHAAEKRGLSVAVQIEPYEKWQRTADVLSRDLGHLQERRASAASTSIGRSTGRSTTTSWAELIAAYPAIELYAQTTDAARAAADGFDGVYTYDVFSVRGGAFAGLCARAHAAGIACAPSVGPGLQRVPVDGGRADPLAGGTGRRMTTCGARRSPREPDRVTITSYNEWHEGTQIEPAKKHPPELYDAYASYEGAYGKYGAASERAYIVRTTYWTRGVSARGGRDRPAREPRAVPSRRRLSRRPAAQLSTSGVATPTQLVVAEVDLDLTPAVRCRARRRRSGRRSRAARPASSTSRRNASRRAIPSSCAELLERVDAHVRVGADADLDPSLEQAPDRREAVAEIGLRRRADADPRAGARRSGRAPVARVRRVDDGRARPEASCLGEKLDRPEVVLGEALLDLARLLARVDV